MTHRTQTEAAVTKAFVDSQSLCIEWSDGHRSRYLGIWLRDNCGCESCGTTLSGQRLLVLGAIPIDISPARVNTQDDVVIEWPDGHESRYAAAWLRQHCNCELCDGERGYRLQGWDAGLDVDTLVHDYDSVMHDDQTLFDVFECIVSHGLVRIKQVPSESTTELGARLGYLHDTNYGLTLDVRVESQAWFRVLSNDPIPPHTDNVYRYDPTGISLFHCIEQIPGGGGASYYVDGVTLAERLRERDADAHACLCEVPLTFYRQIPENASMKIDPAWFKTQATVFRTDQNGQVIGLRYHPRTLAPMTADEATIARVYRARQLLEELSEDPSLRIQFVAEPGECTIYDNHRLMHARTGFEGAEGVRHFRQCHVDREELHSRFRLLGQTLGRQVPEARITPGLV